MTVWLSKHKLALLVSTIMFALMAAVMAEFLLIDDDVFSAIFGDGGLSTNGMLWTWRIGGFVTWPVFMYLMLQPFASKGNDGHQKLLLRTMVIAALYGGGGLWLVTSVWRLIADLDNSLFIFVTPLLAIVSLGMPYLYTWGFVAIYGFTREGLAATKDHGWVTKSLIGTILGVYGIGSLVYLALAMILIPMTFLASILPEDISAHLMLDLCAIALSTGNFVSQWYAFYKVDGYFDAPQQTTYGNGSSASSPNGAPSYPANPQGAMSGQPVMLADGRIVTPDGRVYVPQDVVPVQASQQQVGVWQAGVTQSPLGQAATQQYSPTLWVGEAVSHVAPGQAGVAQAHGMQLQPEAQYQLQGQPMTAAAYGPQDNGVGSYPQQAMPTWQQTQGAYSQQALPQPQVGSQPLAPVQVHQAAPYQQQMDVQAQAQGEYQRSGVFQQVPMQAQVPAQVQTEEAYPQQMPLGQVPVQPQAPMPMRASAQQQTSMPIQVPVQPRYLAADQQAPQAPDDEGELPYSFGSKSGA